MEDILDIFLSRIITKDEKIIAAVDEIIGKQPEEPCDFYIYSNPEDNGYKYNVITDNEDFAYLFSISGNVKHVTASLRRIPFQDFITKMGLNDIYPYVMKNESYRHMFVVEREKLLNATTMAEQS